MPTLIIDGREISVPAGATIMEAARQLGVYIPHFCYHPKLPVAGNCRMCLVEVEKNPKPQIACAMPVNEGMVVHTASPMVREARKGVMEFLLINHPLDCPVCDQGGECSLQDLAMKYGPDRSRFNEVKRQVQDLPLGPLVETVMSRCIHCTRCIRFSTEVAGVEEMGATGRGDHMVVGPGVALTLSSELSGNLPEICPVGALNLKPFHFQARGWELRAAKGVCHHCSVGCRISREHLNGKVKRVQALACDSINETWICDKGRFSYDGLTVDRLEYPMEGRGGQPQTRAGWQQALDRAAELIKGVKPEEVAGLADNRQGAEELYAFQDFLRHSVGTSHMDYRLRLRDFSADQLPLTRADLMMNTPLAKLEQADAILMVGMDARYEVPLLNVRLRKAVRRHGAKAMAIHPCRLNSNLPGLRQFQVHPGEEPAFLREVWEGLLSGRAGSAEAEEIRAMLAAAARPVVLLGDHAVHHPAAESLRRLVVAILEACRGIRPDWNGYNRVLPRGNASAAQDMGVVPHRGPGYKMVKPGYNAREILQAAAAGTVKVLVVLGSDVVTECADTRLAREALAKATVIYIGAFRNQTSEGARVVLPGVAVSEKDATLTNCEGRVQRSAKAVEPPGEAREEWRVLRALSDRFGTSLAYNTQAMLRQAMAEADHRYAVEGDGSEEELAPPCDHQPVTIGVKPEIPAVAKRDGGLTLILTQAFYRDDPVCRRSAVLSSLDQGEAIRVHPEELRACNLKPGQRVRLIAGDRKVEGVVVTDDALLRGVVAGRHGMEEATLQDLVDWQGGFAQVSMAGL